MGLIYLDSCLVIYAVERDPIFGDRVRHAMASAPRDTFVISPLVKLECLVKPLRTGDLVLQRYYEAALEQLELLPLPETAYIQTSHLRARFGLRTPDALHLACAQHYGCEALWTNDGRLAQAAHGLARDVIGTLQRSTSEGP